MRRVPARARGLCLLTPALLFAWATSSSAATPVLQATAGVDGAVKAGRWAPVFVRVHSADAVHGHLIVSWGQATVRRAVSIAQDGARHLELYVRTAEVEDSIRVSIVAGGIELQTIHVPVRVLQPDEPLTLCVAPAHSLARDASTCSGLLTSDQLPRSLRGYDAVDRIEWIGSERALTADRRAALDLWRSLRQLDADGDLSMTGQVSRPTVPGGLPPATSRVIAAFTVAYVGCLIVVGFFLTSAGAPLKAVAPLLAAVIAAAAILAAGIGRAGPGRELRIAHNSLLQQIPAASGSLLTVRGVARFPAFDAYTLRFSPSDAVVEVTDGARSEQTIDADHPAFAGIFGLGARQAFGAEAVTDFQPLGISWNGRIATVTNHSTAELRACRFADGFSPRHPRNLAPGATAAAEQIAAMAGPVLTCTLPRAPFAFTADGRDVMLDGVTTLVLYRSSARSDSPCCT